jgi:hypothetical protein
MKKMKYQEGGKTNVEDSGSRGIDFPMPLVGGILAKELMNSSDLKPMGLIPQLMERSRRRKGEEEPVSVSIEIEKEDMSESPNGMRKGGMTKSGGRDGCAIRGKTKGRMV